MTNSNILILTLLIISALAQSQVQLPVSNCLANCFGCQPSDPLTCINNFNNNTGRSIMCVPYYAGTNCNIGGSFYVNILFILECL